MNFIKILFSRINRRIDCKGNCNQFQVELSNKEILFLHYSLLFVKDKSISQLNKAKLLGETNSTSNEYYWRIVTDSDKLLIVFEAEIRKRKLQKNYFEYQLESLFNSSDSTNSIINTNQI